MPDRYLLEDGTGGYQLEDASGVLLLDAQSINVLATAEANTRSAASTTLTVTIPSTTAGSTIALGLSSDGGTPTEITCGGVSLTGGGIVIAKQGNRSHNSNYGYVIGGHSAGTTSVVVTWNISNNSNGQTIEFSGLDAAPNDTNATLDGVSANAYSGYVTPTVAQNVVVAMDSSGLSDPGASTVGFTDLASVLYTASRRMRMAYKIQTSALPAQTTWTQTSGNWDGLIFVLKAATSTSYVRTLTEAVTSSDAWTRTATYLRTWSDAVTSSDAWTRLATYLRSFTGSVGSSDGWVRVVSAVRTLSEAVTSSDSWARVATYLRTLTQSVTQSDAWTRVATYIRSWSESVSQSDVWAGAKIIARTLTEAVTSSDNWARIATYVRTLTQSVTSGDSWARIATYVRTFSQSVTSSDAWSRVATYVRTLTEATTQSDAWVGLKLIIRSFTQSVTSSDAWTRTVTYARTVSQSVASGDAWTRLATYLRFFDDVPFPTFRSEAFGAQTSNSTTWTPDYPTPIVAGDLLVLNLAGDGNPNLTSPGWQTLVNYTNTATISGQTLVRLADGTESGSFTVTLDATEQGVWRVASIMDWYGDLSGIEASAAGTGNSTAPDPPSVTPSWGTANTYWRAIYAQNDGRGLATGFPDGYDIAQYTNNSGGLAGVSVGSAGKQNAVATEDPGPFQSDRTGRWVAWTLAIRPATTNRVTASDVWTSTRTLVRSFTSAIVHADIWAFIPGAPPVIGGIVRGAFSAIHAIPGAIASHLPGGGSANRATPGGGASHPKPDGDADHEVPE